MRRGTIEFSNVKILVIDEADRMLDMGFIDDIKRIESNLPKERQTLLFSATMPENLKGIATRFTKNPKRIKTRNKVEESLLKQYYCDIDYRRKFSLLVHLIKEETPSLAIVFCNTRRYVDSVSRNLMENGINVEALHGGLSQQRREKVIEKFRNKKINILVATDVAARGLDIESVTHIFNYNIPKNPDEYTNRIGRTARAGKSGKAISLLTTDDHSSFRKIITTFSYNIEKMEVPDIKILKFKRDYENRKNRNSFRYEYKRNWRR